MVLCPKEWGPKDGARGEMQIRFDGKTVAVTGAGHGFGRAIARRFASLGARVFATDVVEATLAETSKIDAGIPGSVTTQIVDLRDRAAGADWIAAIERATDGPID